MLNYVNEPFKVSLQIMNHWMVLFIGGLVKKILETKKDYESSPSTKSKEQVWCNILFPLIPLGGSAIPSYAVQVLIFHNKIPVTWVNAFQNLFIKGISIFVLYNTSGMPDPVHRQFTKESNFANGVEKCNCSPSEPLKCYFLQRSLNN